MWDNRSFDTRSFDERSWLFGLVTSIKKQLFKIKSTVVDTVMVMSRLW